MSNATLEGILLIFKVQVHEQRVYFLFESKHVITNVMGIKCAQVLKKLKMMGSLLK
jgi:hypothetical protein